MREVKNKVFQLNFGSLGDFDIWNTDGEWYAQHMSYSGDSACMMGRYKTFEEASARALDCALQTLKSGGWL